MAVLAMVAEIYNEYIIPMPFEPIPEETKGDELIIVVVSDIPPKKNVLSQAYSFYGAENCKKLIGKLPNEEEEKLILCVPINCILQKVRNLEEAPPKSISPLWTKDRFGISASESEVMCETSKKMMTEIHLRMSKFRNELSDLKIKTNKEASKIIQKCEKIIEETQKEVEKIRSEERWNTAESVAQFIKSKFKVNAWVDIMVEPAVLFCVRSKISDKQAMIIGSSIEGVMNEIEPENSHRFFEEYIYDATVFPVVIDVSFVNGKRTTTKKSYYQTSGGKS